MSDNIIKLHKKGEDSYKFISVRLKESTLKKIEQLVIASNNSRNQIINILLEDAVSRVEID